MSRNSTLYPTHAYPNAHAFRSQKRRDLRALKKAAEEMRCGCAYLPDGGVAVHLILDHIDRMLAQTSVAQWGR